MPRHVINPVRLLAIRQGLSAARLSPYDRVTGDTGQRSLELYEWNNAVSAACYTGLQTVEVVLRNAISAALADWHAAHALTGEWIDDPTGVLDSHSRKDLETAKLRLHRAGKLITADNVISELMFGFWRSLLSSRYENLWTHALRHAFPHLRPQRRKDIADPVERLHKLRNRIAHHEPVHHRNLIDDHRDMMFVLGAVSPSIQDWAQDLDKMIDSIQHRPGSCVPTQRQGVTAIAPGVWRIGPEKDGSPGDIPK